MIGLVGFALQWSDFQPNEPVQTALVENTMIYMMGGFPFVCYMIAAIAFTRFSLTEQQYRKIRAVLDERNDESNKEEER